jgi:hypothetical protein
LSRDFVGQSDGLGPKHEGVTSAEFDFGVEGATTDGEGKDPLRLRSLSPGFEVGVNRHGRLVPVVHPGPFQFGVVHFETKRLDEV